MCGEEILLHDVTGSRNIGKPISTRIRANANPKFQAVRFLVGNDYNLGGRLAPVPDLRNPVRFAGRDLPTA